MNRLPVRPRLTAFSFQFLAMAALLVAASPSGATLITGSVTTPHSHDIGGNTSPFYTQTTHSSNGTVYNFDPANGLSGSIVSGASDVTTISGTISVAGTATFGAGYADGNSIPDGVTLTYPLSFTVTGTNGGTPTLVTANNNTGNGLGVAADGSLYNGIDTVDTVTWSAATIGAASFSGSPTEPGVTLSGLTVSEVGLVGLRSNSFAEGSEGTVVSSGADSVGFGTSSGSLQSNQVINNNTTGRFDELSMSNPIVFMTEQGSWHIKGFVLEHDFSYDFASIPEPASGLIVGLLTAGMASVVGRRGRGA